MKNSKVLKAILFVSGLLLLAIGMATLLTPVEFSARNGIDLHGDISLLNDVRSAGAFLAGSGFVILLGAFIDKLAYTSTIVSIVAYLSYASGRIMSLVIDGMPAEGLVKATVVEIVIGLVGIFAFIKYQENE